jgi:acetate kinase
MGSYALIINAGSSSVKFCIYERLDHKLWHVGSRGQIAGIGSSPTFSARDANGAILAERALDYEVQDGSAAIDAIADWLRNRYRGTQLLGVGHRVVHGGASYARPTVVNQQVLAELKEIIPLAPLHQPYNLAAIEAIFQRLPNVPQVACFDTGFHQGHTEVAKLLPLPRDLRNSGLRRYGFHGLSYEYVASVLPAKAPEIAKGRVIVAHLGGGASLCALKDGESIDNTLGFTALDGLCMGTRPGSLDPGAVLYLFQSLGLSPEAVEAILYKKSGLLGISGISNDMRDILASADPCARLAVDYFVYRLTKEIGASVAVLGGVDGLVFTAGIGENSPEIRRRTCDASAWLGIELDPEANCRNDLRISTPQSKVSVWVIPTNEELMIARHTASLLGLN